MPTFFQREQSRSRFIRWLLVYLMSAWSLQSCAYLSNAVSEKSFGEWRINAGEQVFMRDSVGSLRVMILKEPANALLYTVDDSLFYDIPSLSKVPRGSRKPLFLAHNEWELRSNAVEFDTVHFQDAHFDVDFFTIPFRYRFRQGVTIPASGVASPFCGGLYGGWRFDVASHTLHLLPNQTLQKFTTNGFGIGVFTAFAPVYVSPWNTDYQTMVEYEGLGINYGGAFIWAYQSVTIGLLLGFEMLMDENASIWVYHNKPWVGFALGFNLN